MYVIWLFCIFPSTSFLPSFNNSFPCPLIELPAALVCILCLSWSLFITLLHSSHAFTSVLERYVQTFFFFFVPASLSFFSFVTHHNCSLHLAPDSHLLSVFTATSGDYLFYLFFPSLYFLSLCLCLDVQISWFLSQSISISFVPTCCSGVYP